jgi:heme exporter protein CcmD
MTLSAAWGMGRYAGYVWSCYGLTCAALVWLALSVRRRWRLEIERARRRARAISSTTGLQP